jgi:TPR repeat protein
MATIPRHHQKKSLAVSRAGHTNGLWWEKFHRKTMRTELLALTVALLAANLPAQLPTTRISVFPAGGGDPLSADAAQQGAVQQQAAAAQAAFERQAERQTAIAAARQRELAEIYGKDPWRRIGDATNRAYGNGWVEFQGTVQEARPDGVVFRGAWGPVLTIRPRDLRIVQGEYVTLYGDDLFFMADFPYPATAGQTYTKMLALAGGDCSYTNAADQTMTLPRLVYGTPCVKIWSAEEIAAAQQKLEAQRQAVEDRVLMSNRVLADQGDPYGLRRMGERYRDGDGVPKDLAKARDYFSQAVAAGSSTAASELAKLNEPADAPSGK